jgi:hypothetical protein
MSTKNVLIDALRDLFRNDREYPYREDEFGYPLIPDLTDIPEEDYEGNPVPESVDPDFATKIVISDTHRYETGFHPSIIVRLSGSNFKPISFNDNVFTQKFRKEIIMDGYGNMMQTSVPTHLVSAGAWDQNFTVSIMTKSPVDREELSDVVQLSIMHLLRDELRENGVHIKSVSLGSESEEPFGETDNLYMQDITVETRTEFRREIPIDNVVARIGFCFDTAFETTSPENVPDDLGFELTIT